MTTQSPETAVDPVCGMTVTIADAVAAGLTAEHEGTTYYFCGRGCMLDFTDDPAAALAPGHQHHM